MVGRVSDDMKKLILVCLVVLGFGVGGVQAKDYSLQKRVDNARAWLKHKKSSQSRRIKNAGAWIRYALQSNGASRSCSLRYADAWLSSSSDTGQTLKCLDQFDKVGKNACPDKKACPYPSWLCPKGADVESPACPPQKECPVPLPQQKFSSKTLEGLRELKSSLEKRREIIKNLPTCQPGDRFVDDDCNCRYTHHSPDHITQASACTKMGCPFVVMPSGCWPRGMYPRPDKFTRLYQYLFGIDGYHGK